MTIKEAIRTLGNVDLESSEEFLDAIDMSIKALEHEPILDKIRAEIKAMSGDIETIADVLAIIDKYNVESEDYKTENLQI